MYYVIAVPGMIRETVRVIDARVWWETLGITRFEVEYVVLEKAGTRREGEEVVKKIREV